MNLFDNHPYDFTHSSSSYIDQIIESNEYELLYLKYDNAINGINKFIFNKFLKGFNSSSNEIPIVFDQKFFNLFLASVSLDRILLKYPKKKIQIEATNEELNFNSRFVNLYAFLANKIGSPFEITLKKNNNNFIHFDKFDSSSKDFILKFLVYDFNLLKFYLKRKLFKISPSYHILNYGENLINREIKSELYKSKIGIYQIDDLINKIFDQKTELNILKLVKDISLKKVDEEFSDIKSLYKNEFVFNVFVQIVKNEILNSLSILKEKQPLFRDVIQKIIIKNNKKICLSNGLFGFKGILLFDALKLNGYNVISSQHGLTQGISKHSDYSKFNESYTSDVYFCYNNSTIIQYRKINPETTTKFKIVGGPKTSKNISNKFLNKFYLKTKMNLKGIQVLYLNGINPMNASKSFPTILSNSQIFNNTQHILSFLSTLNKNISFKNYPTEQFLFNHHKHLENEFGSRINFLSKDMDFRYTRPAFDVIITNATQSTLEWCIGMENPIIFLYDRRIMPLESFEVELIFKKCFFFFDYDEIGWEETLKDFLNQPFKQIKKLWNEKQRYRDQYDEEYFMFKNKNAGKMGANFILNSIKS